MKGWKITLLVRPCVERVVVSVVGVVGGLVVVGGDGGRRGRVAGAVAGGGRRRAEVVLPASAEVAASTEAAASVPAAPMAPGLAVAATAVAVDAVGEHADGAESWKSERIDVRKLLLIFLVSKITLATKSKRA